jgi:heat shock protein HslJ
MTTLALTASLFAGVFLVSACGGDDDAEAPVSLDGTSWRLVEGMDITIPDDVEMTIAFEAGGRTSGSGGCNRFMGSYDQAGDQISLGRLEPTRMACAEEVMRAEQAYHSALESVTSWSATGGVLVLSDSAGEALLRYEATSE